jgi:hypothetical protein
MDDHKDVDFSTFLDAVEDADEIPIEVLDIIIADLIEIGYVKIVGAHRCRVVYDLTRAGVENFAQIRYLLGRGQFPARRGRL